MRRPGGGFCELRADGRIADTGFEARGCAISVASADLMAEGVAGRSQVETGRLFEAFGAMARSGNCPDCDRQWPAVPGRWRACTNIRRG